jgi:hypothetical protein
MMDHLVEDRVFHIGVVCSNRRIRSSFIDGATFGCSQSPDVRERASALRPAKALGSPFDDDAPELAFLQ